MKKEVSNKTGVKQDTRFKPGQSGNPNGRPKGTFSLLTILKNKLEETPNGYNKTNAERLIETMINLAIERKNDQQIKNILQYVEGMPKGSGFNVDKAVIVQPILGGNSVRVDNSDQENNGIKQEN